MFPLALGRECRIRTYIPEISQVLDFQTKKNRRNGRFLGIFVLDVFQTCINRLHRAITLDLEERCFPATL